MVMVALNADRGENVELPMNQSVKWVELVCAENEKQHTGVVSVSDVWERFPDEAKVSFVSAKRRTCICPGFPRRSWSTV